MKANEYKVVEDCVKRGIDTGYRRAFKHTDEPLEENIKMNIEEAVMLEICEYFKFEEDKE